MKHNLIIQLVGLIFILILFYLTFPKQVMGITDFCSNIEKKKHNTNIYKVDI